MAEIVKKIVNTSYERYVNSLKIVNINLEKYERELLSLYIEEKNRITYSVAQRRASAEGKVLANIIGVFFEIGKEGGQKEFMKNYRHETTYRERNLSQEMETARTILQNLPYENITTYFNDTLKNGLKKANEFWIMRISKPDYIGKKVN